MKYYMIYFLVVPALILFSILSFAGEWRRLSPEVLQFDGVIEEKAELQSLLQHWDDRVKKLIVNSPGGHTVTGVLMAKFLIDKDFNVEVQGQCMSACANYLFTIANQKTISKGVVGFHGNAGSAFYDLNDATYFRKKQDFTDDDFNRLRDFFGNESTETLLELYDEYEQAVFIEKDIFLKLGVSQLLFDRSQLMDKGMNNGMEYSFLLPKPETFFQFGIKNVFGSHSLEILQTWPVFIENAKNEFDVIID